MEFGFGVFGAVGAHYAGDGFALWGGGTFVSDVGRHISTVTSLNGDVKNVDGRG